jgi:hypothetical protein
MQEQLKDDRSILFRLSLYSYASSCYIDENMNDNFYSHCRVISVDNLNSEYIRGLLKVMIISNCPCLILCPLSRRMHPL